MKILSIAVILITTISCGTTQPISINEQDTLLPYIEIPEYPATYTSGNVIGRMIDGLGYRYYWATDSLTEEDMAYTISEDSRSTKYTLDHLYGLSKFILSVIESDSSIRDKDAIEKEWREKRIQTLHNLKSASDIIKTMDEKAISELKIVFTRGENITEFPFWNTINGPITDAIYHVGQIVSFRRASGNPLNPNVSVFSGKNRG